MALGVSGGGAGVEDDRVRFACHRLELREADEAVGAIGADFLRQRLAKEKKLVA